MTLSNQRADVLSQGTLLIGLGVLFFTGTFWPYILLLIWASIALKQILLSKWKSLLITTIIWLGLFATFFLGFQWDVIMPALFVLGGLFVIFREFFSKDDPSSYS